jgi:hypothetical protein
VAQAEKHTLNVDPDHRVEHVFVIFGGMRHLAFDPGIVEKAIDRAISVECRFDIAPHLGRFGDVGDKVCRRTLLTDYPSGRLAGGTVPVDDDDLGAALGKGDRRGAADAAFLMCDRRLVTGTDTPSVSRCWSPRGDSRQNGLAVLARSSHSSR